MLYTKQFLLCLIFQACQTLCFAFRKEQQALQSVLAKSDTYNPSDTRPKRIAIIGSGITGSVAAFTIAEAGRLQPEGPPVITIFEKNAIIGGRITTAQVFDDPRLTIDTCAATFNPRFDACISSSATGVGLSTRSFVRPKTGVGIWNGTSFEGFVEENGFREPQTWPIPRIVRWYGRYGEAPWTFSTNITQLLGTAFRNFGISTFTSLKAEIQRIGFEKVVRQGVCANDFLECDGEKNSTFVREVVEAGIRERFFQSYEHLNGFDALRALSTDNVAFVNGGNLRLVDRLIKLSAADLSLESTVQNVTRNSEGGWTITYSRTDILQVLKVDTIILAAPLPLLNITISPHVTIEGGDSLTYEDRFVTHFVTPKFLNASYFDSSSVSGSSSSTGPQTILTTASNTNGKDDPPFFALLSLGQVQRPNTTQKENLYKITSRGNLTDEDILLFIDQDGLPPTQPAISWIHKEFLPQSVPRLKDNQTLAGQVEVAPGLFYAGSGEQISATIELGCVVGRNAARLAFPKN